MIYAFLNQKGGVGKTTLSVNVSTALSRLGRRVMLVDADPQGSVLDWSASREDEPLFPVVGLPTKTLHRDIIPHLENYDDIVIDGPPRVNELARSAILAADFVAIPVQPSPYDVWAAAEIVDLLQEAAVFKENMKYSFVINRKITNTAIGRDVVKALSGYDIPVLPSHICQRVAFAESAAQGRTVIEDAPEGSAAAEIFTLTRELLNQNKKEVAA